MATDLAGIVDYKMELKRLQKNLNQTQNPMEQLVKRMQVDGYEEKVPADLKKQNLEKLEGMKKKISDIEETIANFERLLKLEEEKQ